MIINSLNQNESFINFMAPRYYKYYYKNSIFPNPLMLTLSKNGKSIKFMNHFNQPNAIKIANDKMATKRIYLANGIPTPKYYKWNNNLTYVENINKFKVKNLQYPLIVKPVNGTYGQNVYKIFNATELNKTIQLMLDKKKPILIEEYVVGKVFRILVFNDTVIDIYTKEPPTVTGNGVDTLSELIKQTQLYRRRTGNLPIKEIDWGLIQESGYSKKSIIPNNVVIELSATANLNNGATITGIDLNDVHPDNLALFKKINKVSNLNLNGIDYITTDLSIPYYEYGTVLENNAKPGIDGHYLLNPQTVDKIFTLIEF